MSSQKTTQPVERTGRKEEVECSLRPKTTLSPLKNQSMTRIVKSSGPLYISHVAKPFVHQQCTWFYHHNNGNIQNTTGQPFMGPTLFLLYINDLANDITSQMHLFADDSIIYLEINSPEDHQILQDDVNKLATWTTT